MYVSVTPEAIPWWSQRIWKYTIFDTTSESIFAFLENILFLKYSQIILFSFYINYARKKMLKKLFRVPILFKYSQMRYWLILQAVFIIYYSNPVTYLLIWEKTGQVCNIKQLILFWPSPSSLALSPIEKLFWLHFRG